MPNVPERDLLARLVAITARAMERPVPVPTKPQDEAAIAEEDAKRLALLRNPPRR